MKIAMIGQKGIPAHSGGVEQHVEILARLLARMGHRVDVYCRRSYLADGGAETARWDVPGVRPIVRWSLGTKHLDAITNTTLCTLDSLLRDADVIHYHALGPSSLAFLPRLAGRCVVATVHGLDWQRAKWGGLATAYLKLGEWVAARFATQLVVVSRLLRDYFLERHGRPSVFIPNGVRDIASAHAGAMARWDLKPGRFLLTVARLVAEKGQHYLIEAFEKLLAEAPRPDLRLVIVGGSDLNSDYEKRLRAMAGPRVVFTGAVGSDVLAELYENAYLFVLPSEIEGMSLALLEALSCGLAALVSDIPENATVIEDGGFTFRSGSANDLRDRLRMALERRDLVEHAGRAARHVAQAYRWPRVAKLLEQTYQHALEHGSDPLPDDWPSASCPRSPAADRNPRTVDPLPPRRLPSVRPAARQYGPGGLYEQPQVHQ